MIDRTAERREQNVEGTYLWHTVLAFAPGVLMVGLICWLLREGFR